MKLFAKPENTWGWVRVAGLAAVAVVTLWTGVAAVLRAAGPIAWMAWSGYAAFTPLDGFELAAVPLLAIFAASHLEEHDRRVESEQNHHREVVQAAAERQKLRLKRFHEDVLPALPHGEGGAPQEAAARLKAVIREAAADLDGMGRGEALQFLYERGLLAGERPADLTGADFSGAVLQKAHLGGACLQNADLRKARLDGCHLEKAHLMGANLGGAVLRGASLKGAVLSGADFTGAHLENASLEGADLREAVLEGAFLIEANLKHCALSSPDALDQAVLVDAILSGGQKATNARGKEYLKEKEIALLVDRL